MDSRGRGARWRPAADSRSSWWGRCRWAERPAIRPCRFRIRVADWARLVVRSDRVVRARLALPARSARRMHARNNRRRNRWGFRFRENLRGCKRPQAPRTKAPSVADSEANSDIAQPAAPKRRCKRIIERRRRRKLQKVGGASIAIPTWSPPQAKWLKIQQ